jgi:hypothetical protein
LIRHDILLSTDLPVAIWKIVEDSDSDLDSVCLWLREQRQALDNAVVTYGGVLLRGFSALRDAESFEHALLAIGADLMDYMGGTSPRKQVAGRIMTATEVPGNYSIPLHQEMSYLDSAPARISFFCEVPPPGGGETTIGDMRVITQRIDASVRERFAMHGGVQLRRNLPLPDQVGQRPGVPKAWTETFGTSDQSEAEAKAHSRGWRTEWLPDGSMTLWQEVRPPMVRHPLTADQVWYNQVHIFAPAAALIWARRDGRSGSASRLEAALRDTPHLLDCFVFADGSQIQDQDVVHVYDTLEREATPLKWERGDMLVLDNILSAHGRRRFTGERRVLTGLIAGRRATSLA